MPAGLETGVNWGHVMAERNTAPHGTQVIKALVVSNDTIKSLYVYVIIVAQGLRA